MDNKLFEGHYADAVARPVGICHTCKHRTGLWTCRAFPQGIPPQVLSGELDHRAPVIGDGGVIYEALPVGQVWRK